VQLWKDSCSELEALVGGSVECMVSSGVLEGVLEVDFLKNFF